MPQPRSHKFYLDLAARLALRAQGNVEPGTVVGAVLVRTGEIIGLGHHRRLGSPHAEREAIDDCRRRGFHPRGAILFVTLEPCNARGRNPPCVDALIESGVSSVIFAQEDPNPAKAGGAERLRRSGIHCELCYDSPLATGISAPFVKRIRTGLPWVIAKWAQTIDGRIATRSGESKWISNELSRRRVHRLRSRVDAILTGTGTVMADDPMLTARLGTSVDDSSSNSIRKPRRIATRIVTDTDLEIPLDSCLVMTARETPTVVACATELVSAAITREKVQALESRGVRVLGVPTNSSGHRLNLESLLRAIHDQLNASNVLIEAGPGLLGSLFESSLIDEAIVYIAPMMLGDEMARAVAVGRVAESLTAAKRFDLWRVKTLGSDVELTYRRR